MSEQRESEQTIAIVFLFLFLCMAAGFKYLIYSIPTGSPAQKMAEQKLPDEMNMTMIEQISPMVKVEILEKSAGVFPKKGDRVEIHYRGMLENGTEFDSSYKRARPLKFPLGQGAVIPGMEEGILKVPVGSKAKIFIPWQLAYGEEGRGGIIPPKANLIFEIELMNSQEAVMPESIQKPDVSKLEEHHFQGLSFWYLKRGEGETPMTGSKVTVDYSGWLESGKLFDSSFLRGDPFEFDLGGRVIQGWNLMVSQMKKGDSVLVKIPSELAYGKRGANGAIPPGSTLYFQIDLHKFSR